MGIRRKVAAAVLAAATLAALAADGRRRVEAGRAEDRAEIEREVLASSIEFFEDRLAIDPYNHRIAGALADRYLKRFQSRADLADLERAERTILSVLPFQPDSATSYARLSMVRLALHDFPGALLAAQAATRADRSDEAALAVLYDAAVASGDYETARSALAALPPGSFARDLRQARWHAAHGRLDEAWVTMRRLCGEVERAAVDASFKAWCLARIGDLEHERSGAERAGVWFEAALRLEPHDRGALEWLADRAYADGRWEEAEGLYRSIASPAHPDLYLRLTEVSAARGDSEAAARYERDFLRLTENLAEEALGAHALALYHAGRPDAMDRALGVIERDLARRSSIESWEVLAWIRFRRGELALALEASDRARRWGAPSPTSDYHRARILEALGRTGEAKVLYDRALRDPSLLDHHVLLELREERAGA